MQIASMELRNYKEYSGEVVASYSHRINTTCRVGASPELLQVKTPSIELKLRKGGQIKHWIEAENTVWLLVKGTYGEVELYEFYGYQGKDKAVYLLVK